MTIISSILLVDDDSTTNFYNSIVLKQANIAKKITNLDSGSKVLKFLVENNSQLPDIMLLDINMPLMNGWEVLDEINKLDNQQDFDNLQIIMLSASANPDDVEQSKKYSKVQGYITKPLTISKLNEVLNSEPLVKV